MTASTRATAAQPELKPCPFCAAQMTDAGHPHNGCWLSGCMIPNDEVEAWNRRAQPVQHSGNPASTGREFVDARLAGMLATFNEKMPPGSLTDLGHRNVAHALRAVVKFYIGLDRAAAARELDVEAEDFWRAAVEEGLSFDCTFIGGEFVDPAAQSHFRMWLAARRAATGSQAERALASAVCPSCEDKGWGDGEGGLMECPTCGKMPPGMAPSPHSPVGAKEQDK